MRGSLRILISPFFQVGIIPAHAGLTELCKPFEELPWDHPRACGAHSFSIYEVFSVQGSSPRMRGSHNPRLITLEKIGIIPAHAGLTISYERSLRLRRDHPRACGAHFAECASEQGVSGSSPRMRGSLFPSVYTSSHGGIIPAHAGLTKFHLHHDALDRDHPRACGAHTMIAHIA